MISGGWVHGKIVSVARLRRILPAVAGTGASGGGGGSVIVFTLSLEVTAEAQASETRAAIRIANDYSPTTLMGG